MRVLTKKTEEEVRRELFMPVQEAARVPYQLNVDPRKSWCELSELRLSILICQFKPVGFNRHFHLLAIVDHMCKIYDNEHAQSEIFLSDENKIKFRNQQREVLMEACKDVNQRVAYPPKYMCRPSLEVVEKKINEWYGVKGCEENESPPEMVHMADGYSVPESLKKQDADEGRDSDSPVLTPPSKKKKLFVQDD